MEQVQEMLQQLPEKSKLTRTPELHPLEPTRSQDADMRYLYGGAQKPRGAKRKYDGKVDLNPILIKSHPNYQSLRSYGIIAA